MNYLFWISYACIAGLAIWEKWRVRKLERDVKSMIEAFQAVQAAEIQWKNDFFKLLEQVDPQQAAALREFEAKAIAGSELERIRQDRS